MRTWLILFSALAFTACSGDGDDKGTDDTGATAGDDDDDDDDDDTQDPIDAILALTGDASNGLTVYTNNCAFCHMDDGSGGTGPTLQAALDEAFVVETIYYGAGIMSAYSESLTDQEIADVAAHVATFAP